MLPLVGTSVGASHSHLNWGSLFGSRAKVLGESSGHVAVSRDPRTPVRFWITSTPPYHAR